MDRYKCKVMTRVVIAFLALGLMITGINQGGQRAKALIKPNTHFFLGTTKNKDGFTYYNVWGDVYIVGYDGNEENVVVPSEIDGTGVKAICDEVFKDNDKIKSVVISEGIKEICDSAFYECKNLTSVVFPQSLEVLERAAFYLCKSLKEVVLYDNVKEIGKFCFHGCSSLEKVVLPKKLEYIDRYVFQYCKSLQQVAIPDSVKTIGESAFNECTSMKSLKLSENLNTIGYWAFDSCKSLKNVTIPSSVREIGYAAFADCKDLRKLTIKNGVTSIVGYAFYNCDKLQKIKIPKTVKSLSKSAFPVNNHNLKAYVYSRYCKYVGSMFGGNDFSDGTLLSYEDSSTATYADTVAENFLPLGLEAKKTEIKTISRKGKNKLCISYKKSQKAKGYKIQYTTAKTFKKSPSLFVKKTKAVITKLKKGKTYKIRVCGYAKGTFFRVLGDWSKTKSIKM